MRTLMLMLILMLSAGCASTPQIPVEVHGLAHWSRSDLDALLQSWRNEARIVRLPSDTFAFCRSETCEFRWVRAELPIVQGGRPVELVRGMKGRIPLSKDSAIGMLALMDSARRLGRPISYHQESGGVTCGGDECGVDLRIWIDRGADTAPRVDTKASLLRSLVQGALSTQPLSGRG